MNIIEVAEFLSAFAAFMTVFLAVAELFSRSRSKNADKAIETYADHLYVSQQIEYAVNSIRSFSDQFEDLDDVKRKAYAKTHMVDTKLFDVIKSIESESISNFKVGSDEGKNNAKTVLDFTGAAINILILVNTFYQIILDQETCSQSSIQEYQKYIAKTYDECSSSMQEVNRLLRHSLTKIHKSSNIYLFSLILAAASFFAICFVLNLL